MKIAQFIIFSIAILYNSQVYSQQTIENSTKKNFHLSDFYFTSGIISQKIPNASLSDFQKIAPQSTMLNSDLSGYFPDISRSSNTSIIYSIMAGFSFSESQKSNLRLGLSNYTLSYADAQLGKQEITPTDTFTSSQTGEKTYESKVTNQLYSMRMPSQYLRLEAAYIYNLHPQKRVSFYTGFGGATNFSINTHTDISYS